MYILCKCLLTVHMLNADFCCTLGSAYYPLQVDGWLHMCQHKPAYVFACLYAYIE